MPGFTGNYNAEILAYPFKTFSVMIISERFSFSFAPFITKSWNVIFPCPKLFHSYNIIWWVFCIIVTLFPFLYYFLSQTSHSWVGKSKSRWTKKIKLAILCCLLWCSHSMKKNTTYKYSNIWNYQVNIIFNEICEISYNKDNSFELD